MIFECEPMQWTLIHTNGVIGALEVKRIRKRKEELTPMQQRQQHQQNVSTISDINSGAASGAIDKRGESPSIPRNTTEQRAKEKQRLVVEKRRKKRGGHRDIIVVGGHMFLKVKAARHGRNCFCR